MDWREALVGCWRLQEQFGKPSARKAMIMARLMGARFTDAQGFSLLAKFSSAAAPPQSRSTSAAENEHKRSTSEALPPQSRRGFVRTNKELLVTKNIPPSSSNELLSPPRGKERLIAQTVTFESEDERRVGQCLVLIAAQNKTGMVSSARILTLRGQMHAELESLGPDRWRYGLDEAIARGKPWDYARAVMRKTLDVPAERKLTLVQNPAVSRPMGSERRRGWSNDTPNADKLTAIEAIMERNTKAWNTAPQPAQNPDHKAVS